MRNYSCSVSFATFVLLIVGSQSASAINLWGPSTTDSLVRLQALAFIKEAPASIEAINAMEKKAQTDRKASKQTEEKDIQVFLGEALKRVKALETRIASETSQLQHQAKAKREKKASEYEKLLVKQKEDQAALNQARQDIEEDAKKWTRYGTTGRTQEEVDELEQALEETTKAVADLNRDLLETAVLEPIGELAVELKLAQAAEQGIRSQLSILANTIALPSEDVARYEAQRAARKKAAFCMVTAAHCNSLKVESFDAINANMKTLNKCADDNLAKVTKATKSSQVPACNSITTKSSTEEIGSCVAEYRKEVLKKPLDKPETKNSYEEYNDCDGLVANIK